MPGRNQSIAMLEPLLEVLSTQRIILASGSPRRSEILQKIGLKFDVIPSLFEENLDKSVFNHPSDYVLENSKQKTLEVARRIDAKDGKKHLIIGADTVVVSISDGCKGWGLSYGRRGVLNEKILEKPSDKDHAFEMLKSLSGKDHQVFSGVTLVQGNLSKAIEDSNMIQFYEETLVSFGDLTDDVICGTKQDHILVVNI
ncbi:putative bifunctional dTTP/UTP pyrophosphatase/methyltransferase protein [Acropora cervicornis]|uniref:Bifunctional dTTP/UTP pyrophosphatase/methyltransferase protein n=1 Tax=Acropora cervicornis TaxID=6130 RepID=A0AAD9VBN2_ACRCE|nr:putative bifunctional dTTP/UTP pyrophosphatase/methyltransferase protein [Acropora cervicornis]